MSEIKCGNFDVIVLTTGDYLVKHYGKYGSGIGIIVKSNDPDIVNDYIRLFETSFKGPDFNISKMTQLNGMRGEFFTSKKGTKLFRKAVDGKHLFLRDDWGGPFNKYRGRELPDKNGGALYFKRASSNGGGTGYDYSIIPLNWKREVSEEDL